MIINSVTSSIFSNTVTFSIYGSGRFGNIFKSRLILENLEDYLNSIISLHIVLGFVRLFDYSKGKQLPATYIAIRHNIPHRTRVMSYYPNNAKDFIEYYNENLEKILKKSLLYIKNNVYFIHPIENRSLGSLQFLNWVYPIVKLS